MDEATLTNKAKAIISGISSAVAAAASFGVVPAGTPQSVTAVGAAVLAVITALYAVSHLVSGK